MQLHSDSSIHRVQTVSGILNYFSPPRNQHRHEIVASTKLSGQRTMHYGILVSSAASSGASVQHEGGQNLA